MSVRKRVLLSGEVRWLLDYKDQGGKRRAKQFPTKYAANAYEAKVRGELLAGTHVAASASITIAEAGEIWLQRCSLEQLEASTIRQYRQHLHLHILPLLGSKKLSELTKPIIENFRDKLCNMLSDRGRGGEAGRFDADEVNGLRHLRIARDDEIRDVCPQYNMATFRVLPPIFDFGLALRKLL